MASRLLKRAVALGIAALAVVGLVGCAPQTGSNSASGTQLTFRLWDPTVAAAYKQSFSSFTKQHPNIHVKVDVVPWANYFTKLKTDIASNSAADVYWTNGTAFTQYAEAGKFINVTKSVGSGDWVPSVVKQYSLKNTLWGVPQIWDALGLYYNADALTKAGLTPADVQSLKWSPDASQDTLLPVAQKLTLDATGKNATTAGFDSTHLQQYGYNAALDLQAIWLNYVGQNGGTLQSSGTNYTIDSPQSTVAFQYLVDLINKEHVAPSAADTNTNGDFSLNSYLQGKMGLFQSGTYNLAQIAKNAKFKWGVAPIVGGPLNSGSVVNGIVAVGNAQSAHQSATVQLLKWLGSAQGQKPLALAGAAIPANTTAEQTYLTYWKQKNVDISAMVNAAKGTTFTAPYGANANAALTALVAPLQTSFLGKLPVADALRTGQAAANKAAK